MEYIFKKKNKNEFMMHFSTKKNKYIRYEKSKKKKKKKKMHVN